MDLGALVTLSADDWVPQGEGAADGAYRVVAYPTLVNCHVGHDAVLPYDDRWVSLDVESDHVQKVVSAG